MLLEGAVGLWQGLLVGSIALTGWALGSAVEGLASVIVVWRFTGERTLSETAERRAQRGVALSFWLIAPYIAAESLRNLLGEHRSEATIIGIVLTATAVMLMPLLGYAKRRLGTKLDSAATAGEGAQNYLCAAQAAAVLVGLAITAVWSGGWWVDPVIGLAVAAMAVWEGIESWRGDGCQC
jgi:divalent metal cation (Fe/Co/Zn/Cd) transporter